MPYTPPEPERQTAIHFMQPYLIHRVDAILARMRSLGFDPVVFETLRTPARQYWLYCKGRCHSHGAATVTNTMDSLHLRGKAVDIISASTAWSDPLFFRALGLCARAEGMHQLPTDLCHIEWRG